MNNLTIGVVGLGYVGLPLALEFGKKFHTIGFDISKKRIASLSAHNDENGDVDLFKFKESTMLKFSSDPEALSSANFIIVAVPTPVDNSNTPDLTILKKACELVGKNLSPNCTVVFESTVYPGATEDDCVPILEKFSGKKWKKDFFVGYSPERINPGDKIHTIDKIVKVVSGDNPATLNLVADVYSSIVTAGVFRASSIKVAEAAKVIENTQRDLNIALINELSKIFELLNISTYDVLEAAGTKWNFLQFKPGLVGGHCIGVDPYYLTHKSQQLGYHPEVILAGRRINDGMGKYVASTIVKKLLKSTQSTQKLRVNILGITFKENVSDIRNSKVIDIIKELNEYGVETFVVDPIANEMEVLHEYGIKLTTLSELLPADALVLSVAHDKFKNVINDDYVRVLKSGGAFFDLKGMFLKEDKKNNSNYWTL